MRGSPLHSVGRTRGSAAGARRWSVRLILLVAATLTGSFASAQVSVTATAGTPGPTAYPTVKLAFEAINAGTHRGAIAIEIGSGTVEGSTPAVLNGSGAGPASYTSVSIRPTVDGVTIEGSPPAGRGVVELNGADNVSIDGDNPNTSGINRDLTIRNSAASGTTYASVVRIALSTLVSSANGNSVRNCVILGNAIGRNDPGATSTTGSENTTYGILVGGGASTFAATTAPSPIASVNTTIGAGITATDFTVENNLIDACARGVAVQGSAATVANLLTVSNNSIGSATPGNPTTVYARGLTLQGFDNATISGNTVRNMAWFVGLAQMGIGLGDVSPAGANAVVERNTVDGVNNRSTSTYGAYGINAAAGGNLTLRNNVVTGITGDVTGGAAFSTTFGIFGIRIAGGTGHRIYHNSVHLSGVRGGAPTATHLLSAAVAIVATGQTGCDVRNNIFSNVQSGGASSLAYASIYLPSGGTTAMNLVLNRNAYYSGTGLSGQGLAQVGTNTGSGLYLASNFDPGSATGTTNFRTYTSGLLAADAENDNASFASTSPAPFVSSSDLHIATGLALTPLESSGVAAGITGVTADIDGETRPGPPGSVNGGATAPDLGADEFDGVPLLADDIQATAFVDPLDGGLKPAGEPFFPEASFRNVGSVAQSGVIVRYRVVDAGLIEVYNQTASIASIAPMATSSASFPAATLGAGTYTIEARAELVSDQSAGNDVITGSLVVAEPLSGTYGVGSGGAFASLTNAGGAFEELNSLGATGDVILEIVSDLVAETGAVELNSVAGGFGVTIRPAGSARSIIGSSSAGLITLNAADFVTIDGSLSGGTDRSLSITNTHAGTTSAVVWLQSDGVDGATQNTIENLNVVGSGGAQTLFGIGAGGSTIGTASPGSGNHGNTIRNNRILRTQYGIYSQGASAAAKNTGTVISQNRIDSPAPDNVTRGGIWVGHEDGVEVTGNRVGGMALAGPPDVFGITLGFTAISSTSFTGNEVTNASVAGNFIGRVTNTGTYSAVGIAVASAASGTNLVANNSIHGVGANGTSGDLGAGILVGGGGSTTLVYHNSVSMTGTFTGGSYPNYALAIGGADPIVDVRNNALFNTIANGSGVGFAIGTSSIAFTNLTSHFNDFFVPSGGGAFKIGKTGSLTPGAGMEHASLGDWIAATGKDTPNSIGSNPAFISTTDLQPQLASPLLGAGTPVVVTIDITGAARSGSVPSIGAYETGDDAAGPTIVYTPLGHTNVTTNRTLGVSVSDPSGVPTSGTGRPVVYYFKAPSGPVASGACSFLGGGSYACPIDHAAVGGVSLGETIAYYVAAQDTGGRVSVNPSAGAGGFTADPPAASTPPLNPNTYAIAPAYFGSFDVGAGETITSLTNAGGLFALLGGGVLTGDVTVNLTSDLTAETGAVALDAWAEEGAVGTTLTIRPGGGPRVVSGTSTASALIKLNGADRVTIDGSLAGGTDRSLSIRNFNDAGVVIWIGSSGAANGSNHVTVENCAISGSGGQGTLAGIVAGSGATLGGAAEAPNSNNTLRNNFVSKVQNAVFVSGPAVSLDRNWLISENTFGGGFGDDELGFRGVLIANARDFTISRNSIRGIVSSDSTSSTMTGIQIAGAVAGGAIEKNKIGEIRQMNPAGWGSNAIYLGASSTDAAVTVSNNFIQDVASYGYPGVQATDNGYGIVVASGGGYAIYHNSIHLHTNQALAGGVTAGINVLDTVTLPGAIDLRNNISALSQTVGTRYGVYCSAPATVFSTIDHNDYFAQNVGYLGSARGSLADWRSATSQDADSLAADPLFVSPADLHMASPGLSPVEDAGTPLAAVTTDIDGETRSSFAPDIGADEIDRCAGVTCDPPEACAAFACDPADGLCKPVYATNLCRPAVDLCDLEENCTGSSPECPEDLVAPITTECRASAASCDPAEFCTGTGSACPPDVVEKSAPVNTTVRLSYDKPLDATTIAWPDEFELGPFNVYRGSLTLGRPFAFNQGCLAEGVVGTSVTDTYVPPPPVVPGSAFYYLVSRKEPSCAESSLGMQKLPVIGDAERPSVGACPSPGNDADADGIIDALDNCPVVSNLTQADADVDGIGDACDNCPDHYNPFQNDVCGL